MTKIVDTKKKLPIIKRALLWHFNYYLLGKNSPLITAFQLTNRCNLKCKMCSLWKNPEKNTLPLETFQKIIDDMNLMGCAYTTLSGGEPLVIKDIFSYAVHAARKIPFVNMVTNGQLLDSSYAKELAKTKISMLSISIDGPQKVHDEIRGIPGAFDRAMKAVENMKLYAPKVGITINTVISPWNLNDILDFVNLTEKMGLLHKFQPIYRHPVFKGQQIKDSDWGMAEHQIKQLKEITKQLKHRKNVANSYYYLSSIPTYFAAKNTNGLFRERCKSVHFYCEIRENGSLFPCLEGMGWEGGFNLSGGNFRRSYHSPEYRKLVMGLRDCKRCQEILPICYMESRIAFPISSYFKYTLMPFIKDRS